MAEGRVCQKEKPGLHEPPLVPRFTLRKISNSDAIIFSLIGRVDPKTRLTLRLREVSMKRSGDDQKQQPTKDPHFR
ncbi:unnamed protein product [Toxocara canis]|uniref:Uncharacterized protein n=1 Tax=Toxocara canis TaxID=6265 RepID=A0A183VEH2_TOXCA|nr:unnamed protein product [Toxocara canis]